MISVGRILDFRLIILADEVRRTRIADRSSSEKTWSRQNVSCLAMHVIICVNSNLSDVCFANSHSRLCDYDKLKKYRTNTKKCVHEKWLTAHITLTLTLISNGKGDMRWQFPSIHPHATEALRWYAQMKTACRGWHVKIKTTINKNIWQEKMVWLVDRAQLWQHDLWQWPHMHRNSVEWCNERMNWIFFLIKSLYSFPSKWHGCASVVVAEFLLAAFRL